MASCGRMIPADFCTQKAWFCFQPVSWAEQNWDHIMDQRSMRFDRFGLRLWGVCGDTRHLGNVLFIRPWDATTSNPNVDQKLGCMGPRFASCDNVSWTRLWGMQRVGWPERERAEGWMGKESTKCRRCCRPCAAAGGTCLIVISSGLFPL